MIGVYKITNLATGKCYVGKSQDIEGNWKNHKRIASNGGKRDDIAFEENGTKTVNLVGRKWYNLPLYSDIREYGEYNFQLEVLVLTSEYHLYFWWKYYFDKIKPEYKTYFVGDVLSSTI